MWFTRAGLVSGVPDYMTKGRMVLVMALCDTLPNGYIA
jgi:hypothetical protein